MIGSRVMAVNRNYVIHLVENAESLQQSIRVYSRKGSNIEKALFERILSEDAITGFITFPNPFFDTVIMRDEREI